MALKRFVARHGLESGGGVAFPVTRVNSGTINPYQALDTDFFIESFGNTNPDIYLPQISGSSSGEQRQIVGIENLSELPLSVYDYGGGIKLNTLFRGDVAIYQVTQDYSSWQRISDTSIIRQSGAEGTSVRIYNNNGVANDSLFSTISGGTGNSINLNSTNSTISGGEINTIGTFSWRSTVAGGSRNTIDGSHHSVISGGARNSIYGLAGSQSSGYFIGGGSGNGVTGTAQYSSVVGGLGNTAGSAYSAILGGQFNQIREQSENSVIAGGFRNKIGDGSVARGSFIGGGYNNLIDSSPAQPSSSIVIVGGSGNYVGGRLDGAFIGGGLSNVAGEHAFVGGGISNSAGSPYTAIVGGTGNRINVAPYSSIVGGRQNVINTIGNTESTYTFIGGGYINTIGFGATGSAILGGRRIIKNNSVQYGAILGGRNGVLSHNDSFVMGRGVASVRENTTHVANLYVEEDLSYNDGIPVGFASGEVVYFGSTQAGVGMTAGFIYEYGGTGSWGIARADTSANASGLLGIALGSTPSTGILLKGFARYNLSSYTGMGVTGGQQYLSKTSTGTFSGTQPGASGDIVRIIGYCVNPTTSLLYFSPDTTWITRIS